MNDIETKFTITGAFIACLLGVYYVSKKGTNRWSNMSIKQLSNEFLIANEREKKKILNVLSFKQTNDLLFEIKKKNDDIIVDNIERSDRYQEHLVQNLQDLEDTRQHNLREILGESRHNSNEFLSKKTGTGKHKHGRKHKRSKKHKRQ